MVFCFFPSATILSCGSVPNKNLKQDSVPWRFLSHYRAYYCARGLSSGCPHQLTAQQDAAGSPWYLVGSAVVDPVEYPAFSGIPAKQEYSTGLLSAFRVIPVRRGGRMFLGSITKRG